MQQQPSGRLPTRKKHGQANIWLATPWSCQEKETLQIHTSTEKEILNSYRNYTNKRLLVFKIVHVHHNGFTKLGKEQKLKIKLDYFSYDW